MGDGERKDDVHLRSSHRSMLSQEITGNSRAIWSKCRFGAEPNLSSINAEAANQEKKAYIVYMGDAERKDDLLLRSSHIRMLSEVITSGDPSKRLIYSYTKVFNAFAAMLSDAEARKLSDMDEVVSVFPNQQRKLLTTKSWSFIGFPESRPSSAFESDVIVGIIDSGIWPESESFDDTGFGPPPHKWKGTCQTSNHNFACNNKIIGARYYHRKEYISAGNILSPHDNSGHGSHVSSIAAGCSVANVSLSDLAAGIARGAVPSARLAIYKVCWNNESADDMDILRAFEDAVADGVDIINISLGSKFYNDYFLDPIAIGSFHATKNDILVVSAAGNFGPGRYTVRNFAPWMLTVGASTIDRKFVAAVTLGNGEVYQGMALNTDEESTKLHPLIYAANAPNKIAGYDESFSRRCVKGSLDEEVVRGSVLICDTVCDGSVAKAAGAIGAIMPAKNKNDWARGFKLPVSVLGANDFAKVLLYSKTRNPTASISNTEEVSDTLAPYVVSFSSRGPHPITDNLLKLDLAAPGVNIIAAWSPLSIRRSSLYNIESGTSMACPHVSGCAAYVKSFHPTWSPAAIKSALITTASIMSPDKNTEAQFAYGAGQVNVLRAIKSGLVYDAEEIDYIKFLRGQGYTTEMLRLVTKDTSTCDNESYASIFDLNYPTFALLITTGKHFSATYNRTVTNVGDSNSTYNVHVSAPSELKIKVDPEVLTFQSLLEKKSFVVTIEGKTNEPLLSASLMWSDNVHTVTSPIIVYAD